MSILDPKYKRTGKKLAPRAAKTENQICSIERDHKEWGDWMLMLCDDGTLVLSEHKPGEEAKQRIEIPRRVFNFLIDWYNSPEHVVREVTA